MLPGNALANSEENSNRKVLRQLVLPTRSYLAPSANCIFTAAESEMSTEYVGEKKRHINKRNMAWETRTL